MEYMQGLICQKVADVLELTPLDAKPDEELASYGLDSIKLIRLIILLEEAFNVSFDENELLFQNFSTLHKITDRVASKLTVGS